jgi:hypothetical protein
MPSGPQPKLETPIILSDNPLRRKNENPAHFYFEQFAATLALLIADKRTRHPADHRRQRLMGLRPPSLSTNEK